MAGSNSPFGSGGISALLRSANSIRSSIDAYNDEQMAYDYKMSGHTDDAFQAYSDYLKGRIKTLQNGDISSQQKALSLTSTLDTAYHANVSARIQRANIAIMAGNATLRDKYSLISDQFSQAVANEDYTLAQSLESQAYSVSQQIQYEEQQAATAANALAEATARAGARSEAQLGDTLKQKLKDFNYDYAHTGQKTANALLGQFVKDNADTFAALGITLPDGVQPTYFDVVDGVNRAIYKAYSLAGDAVAPYATDGGQSYYDQASAVVDKIPTIYGDMNAQQLLTASANPQQFSYNEAPDYQQATSGIGGKQNPQVGYKYTPQGGVAPVTANSVWTDVSPYLKQKLADLGLNIVGTQQGNPNAYTVSASKDKTPNAIKQLLPDNATTVVTAGNSQLGAPGLQFEADAKDGQGKAVYTIVYDQQGRKAVYESSNLGDRIINSDPGYDATFAPMAKDYKQPQQPGPIDSFFSRLGDAAYASLTNFGSAFGGGRSATTNPSKVVQMSAAEYARQQKEDAAAAALLGKLPQLPNLTVATPPPLPNIAVAQPKPLPTLTVAKPKPLPVAQTTASPQAPAQLAIQGGGSLLQGGTGIRLQ